MIIEIHLISSKNYYEFILAIKNVLIAGKKTKMIPVIVIASLFVSFLDLFGIALIGPFISLTLVDEGNSNQFISILTNLTGATSYSELLTILGAILVATFILKNFGCLVIASG